MSLPNEDFLYCEDHFVYSSHLQGRGTDNWHLLQLSSTPQDFSRVIWDDITRFLPRWPKIRIGKRLNTYNRIAKSSFGHVQTEPGLSGDTARKKDKTIWAISREKKAKDGTVYNKDPVPSKNKDRELSGSPQGISGLITISRCEQIIVKYPNGADMEVSFQHRIYKDTSKLTGWKTI